MEEAVHQHWPLAPIWAVNAGVFGKGLILAALVCFLWTMLGWAFSVKQPQLAKSAKWTLVLGGICVLAAFVTLGTLFVNNQFEYTYVFSHGDADTEVKYKIAGIWAGQQGSFLLWALTSSVFGILVARVSGPYRRWFSVVYAGFLATLCGILAYETPFEMARLNGQALLPPQGAGLVPSLQNYWVVIHPPTIFTGFGSLTVAFALGLAAMFSGNLKDWVPILRPWAILSTALVGLGLCMGGFWAYETLGWGGFWMWDPVENVSFVPWIFSAALLHGLLVQTTKGRWFNGNLVLAGLPFILFCYGTFLTRSGFLADASVHSFAEMNKSALWILALFVAIATLGYFAVYAFRGVRLAKAAEPQTDNPDVGVRREAMYQSGVLLLCGLAATIAVGMSVPFFLALVHRNSKVVDEALYHLVVVWFFLPILVLMGVAPFIPWQQLKIRRSDFVGQFRAPAKGQPPVSPVVVRLTNVILVSLGMLGLALLWVKFSPSEFQPEHGARVGAPFHTNFPLVPWMLILMAVCIFCFVANLWRAVETFKRSKMSIGGFVSHMGIAILMGGLIVSRGFERKESIDIQLNDSATALGYNVRYSGMTHEEEGGLLRRDNQAKFTLESKNDAFLARLGFYVIPGNDGKPQFVVWPYIEHKPTYDIYMEIFAPQTEVWKEPQMFSPGETQQFGNDMSVTYNGFKMIGKPGQMGTQFVGDVIIRITGRDGITRSHEVQPSIQITQDGLKKEAFQVDDEFAMTMEGMDAGTKSAAFQLHFIEPVFPVDLFYKPMAGLVWLGAGVTAFGGFLAAWYRRKPKIKVSQEGSSEAQEAKEKPEPVAV